MKLLTKELIRKFPAIGETSEKDPSEVEVIAKFFTPWAGWTWYATECQEEEEGDYLFFGYVVGHERELGYFVLSELEGVKGPFELTIERDLHWSGTLADVMSGKRQ